MSERFHRAFPLAELERKTAIGVILNRWPVVICRSGDAIHAIIDKCPHAYAQLSKGRVRSGEIMCPLHGARFELATGRCVGGAYAPLKTYAHRVVEGWVEVAVPDEAPGAEHMPVGAPG